MVLYVKTSIYFDHISLSSYYLLTFLLTYLFTYLLHGAEAFLKR
jgi:hypothetical protein